MKKINNKIKMFKNDYNYLDKRYLFVIKKNNNKNYLQFLETIDK